MVGKGSQASDVRISLQDDGMVCVEIGGTGNLQCLSFCQTVFYFFFFFFFERLNMIDSLRKRVLGLLGVNVNFSLFT